MLLRIALLLILFAPASSVFAQWNQDAQDCFEETKPETFHPDKALPLCERAMNSGQLTPKNVGAMHYYRGTIRTYRKDHKGALEDYTEAIKLDPTLPQAYNSRGFSLFFLGDFQPAQKDFFYASELRPEDVYAKLWLYIVISRSGEDGKPMLTRVSREVNYEEWPGPIVSMYMGNMTPQAVINAATDRDPQRQREKKCEAYFYAGQQLLIEGKKNEAVKMMRAAFATNVTKFIEHEAARVELQRLSGGK
jgi:lipoprotein NlpI